jgi:hypothetical protein
MKKKLEADLMSIAHRILQIKNKSDINQLCIETQRLYEKLAVLRFLEEHFEGVKPTIGKAEIMAKMEPFFEENHLPEGKPAMTNLEIVADHVVEEEISAEGVVDQEKEEIAEEQITPRTEVESNETELDEKAEEEEITEVEPAKLENDDFLPAFELDIEAEEAPETAKKGESVQISFEELLGADYKETHFVKVDHDKTNSLNFELPKEASMQSEKEDLLTEIQVSPIDIESKNVPKIDKQATGISVGLNDRIAFVKHLFGNSDVDYTRVMNQLITYDSFEEAQNFIEDMVKPDYGDWQGKEEYEQRFIEIIEKKFA